MGNRCVITNKEKTIAVYQHWNGGRDTIEPLLKVAKDLGKGFNSVIELSMKVFDGDVFSYDVADVNNGDNGTYIIDDELNIVGREFFNGTEQNSHNPCLMEIFIRLVYELGDEEKAKKIMGLVEKIGESKNEK